MFNLKRFLTLLITTVLALGATSVTAAEDIPGFEAGIDAISLYGNIILNITGSRMLALGYGYGDLVTVEINGQAVDMPIGSNYSDVDSGRPVLRIFVDEGKEIDAAILGVMMGDYATTYGVATKTVIEAEPGYRWEYDPQTAVTITLLEKGGYLEEYQLRQMRYTNDRSDYPQLTDEEYANFRAVTTTGIFPGALYRSSSPINPTNNRNTYADEALNNAGVQTILNLADTEASMKAFEGYAYTYYAQRDVIAVNLGADFTSESCKAGVRDALAFLAERDGPYLVHCLEGKDRAGFVSAVLECLAGASIDEVTADYAKSFINYYGVETGSRKYKVIVNNIKNILRVAFKTSQIDTVDLSACARAYLLSTGLSDETLDKVIENPGKPWTD